MIDLHTHILAGLDDGPETLDQSLAMCRIAAEDGITTVVATPHQRHEWWPNADRATLKARFGDLRAAADGVVELALGAEIRVDSELLEDLDRLPGGMLLPLAGSRYLLIEFPTVASGPDPRTLVHELAVGGWWPVLAHPERIPWLAEAPEVLAALLDRGACVQLTAMSVTGDAGPAAMACAWALLDADLVHFIASDAHDTSERPPVLSAAFRAVADGWGEARALRLTEHNARAVLENRPLGTEAVKS
jgi:protein-tyrosine phosphatase